VKILFELAARVNFVPL